MFRMFEKTARNATAFLAYLRVSRRICARAVLIRVIAITFFTLLCSKRIWRIKYTSRKLLCRWLTSISSCVCVPCHACLGFRFLVPVCSTFVLWFSFFFFRFFFLLLTGKKCKRTRRKVFEYLIEKRSAECGFVYTWIVFFFLVFFFFFVLLFFSFGCWCFDQIEYIKVSVCCTYVEPMKYTSQFNWVVEIHYFDHNILNTSVCHLSILFSRERTYSFARLSRCVCVFFFKYPLHTKLLLIGIFWL